MKKDEKKKHPRGASTSRDVVRDWQPLFARLQDTIDWALDIALKLARDYQEDVDAIERRSRSCSQRSTSTSASTRRRCCARSARYRRGCTSPARYATSRQRS